MTYWGKEENLSQAAQMAKLFYFVVFSSFFYSIDNFMSL